MAISNFKSLKTQGVHGSWWNPTNIPPVFPRADRFKKLHSQDVRQMLGIYLTKRPKRQPLCSSASQYKELFMEKPWSLLEIPVSIECSIYSIHTYSSYASYSSYCCIKFLDRTISPWTRQLIFYKKDQQTSSQHTVLKSFLRDALMRPSTSGPLLDKAAWEFRLANKASFIVPSTWNPTKHHNSVQHPRDPWLVKFWDPMRSNFISRKIFRC